MTVAGILLAAGAGRRMGGPKALVEFDGEPLVCRGIRLLLEAGCDPVLVVVGARAEQVRPLCGGAEVVEAADWESGMGASLRAGLARLEAAEVRTVDGAAAPTAGSAAGPTAGSAAGPAAVDAVVVALVDQPLVTVAVIARLRAAHAGGAVAAVASYAGQARNPVLLDSSSWAGVREAALGDQGARDWLRAHPELVVAVDCSDIGAPDDLDTPQDLTRMTNPKVAAR